MVHKGTSCRCSLLGGHSMASRRSRAFVAVLIAFSLVSTGAVMALEPTASWYWQNPLPQGNDLLDLAFEPGGNVGWAVGRGGALLKTSSQGAMWARATSPVPPEAVLYSVAAPAAGVLWIAAGGELLHSVDAGSSWSRMPVAGSAISVRFRDATHGWCGTQDGRVLWTADGGTTWSQAITPTTDDPRGVTRVITEGSALVAVVGQDIWCSTDGGARWSVARDGDSWAPKIAFATPSVGVAIEGGDSVRTIDGGRTWSSPADVVSHTQPDIPDMMMTSEVWFASPTTGYVMTDTHVVYRTDDAGLTWAKIAPPFLDRYGESAAAPPMPNSSAKVGTRWLFCGESGSITYTSDSGATYQNITSDFNEDLRAASFDTTLTGLGVTEGDMLLTNDGGALWSRMPISETLYAMDVALADGKGWVVGGGNVVGTPQIFRVQRTGTTYEFTAQQLPASLGTMPYGHLKDVWTDDGITAWATGWLGPEDDFILKTTNAGVTWRKISVPNAPRNSLGYQVGLRSVQVFASGGGWAVGNAPGLMRTSDGGEDWTNISESIPVRVDEAWALDGSTCVVVGVRKDIGNTAIAITKDSGVTWDVREYPGPWAYGDMSVGDVYFSDETNGWILITSHYQSLIHSTSDGGLTWATSESIGSRLESLAGSDDSVWAVGSGGRVLFNGGAGGDFVPPAVRTNAPTGWSLGDATVYLAGVDQCGVSDLQWRFEAIGSQGDSLGILSETPTEYQQYTGPIKVSAEGRSRIVSYAEDVNGNRGTESRVDVQVDKSAPTTLVELRGPHSMSPSVALTPSDSGAGVRNTYSSLDGATAKLYGAPFAVPRLGWHRLEYWSTDYAGRSESRRAVEFAQDGRAAHLVIAGSDRFATSAQMSQRAFPDGAASVVLATGRNWPDALGGASLAGAVNGPVLLVDTNAVPSVAMDEIRRLGADRIFILGGASAIGPDAEASLVAEFGRSAVERIAGATRYATAEKVAARVVAEQGAEWDGTCLLATGANFPDALAASPLAASKGWPLLLSEKASLTDVARSRIVAMGAKAVVVLGGSGALSPTVESQVRSIPGVTSVGRLSGADRYETAVRVARYGHDKAGLAWNGLALSTGMNYPDALSGGVAQGRLGSVVLLTRPNALSAATQACMQAERSQITDVVYLGGGAAVGIPVRASVQAILR